MNNYTCEACGKEMPDDYEPEICCSGVECPCNGRPVNTPFCCEQCREDYDG